MGLIEDFEKYKKVSYDPKDYLFENPEDKRKRGFGLFREQMKLWVPQFEFLKFETKDQLLRMSKQAMALHFLVEIPSWGKGIHILGVKNVGGKMFVFGDLSPFGFSQKYIATVSQDLLFDNGMSMLDSEVPSSTPNEVIERDLKFGIIREEGNTYKLNINCIKYGFQ